MQTIHNKIVKIEGHHINTLQAGDSSALPILLLHGKAFQAETWQGLGTLEKMASNGLFVIALDLPGYGKSAQAPLSADVVINQVMHAAGIDKAIIVGPSMGGKIALEYTLKQPETVHGLVLVGSVGVLENRERLCELPSSTL
ncbi:MAG: alpha/beta hydrolase, partial [Proteobacteria bacterium]|nr:alpha/beta hydrolase [Pseudomonadota bacterium]